MSCHVLLFAAAGIFLGGCEGALLQPPLPREHPPVAIDEVDAATKAHLGVAPPSPREARRVDLDQLENIIEDFTGSRWVDSSESSRFFPLHATLGVADYVKRTHEDLSVSPLFQKYLDDASREVCQQAVDRDYAAAAPSRKLLRGALDDPNAVLSAMIFRAHGRRLGAPALSAWRQLYDAVSASEGEQAAWVAVCVAAVRHPDFYSY
jgi:hypothetical protein